MIPRAFWHYLAAFTIAFQTLCGALWWLLLGFEPRLRPLFRPALTPDSALLAFFLPGAVLLGLGAWSAWALMKCPAKARLPLALYVGSSVYAALYCIAQTLLTGEASGAAILMTLGASCGAFLAWKAVGGN
jgi:hypothetical protein